jgi:hypothetical protein
MFYPIDADERRRAKSPHELAMVNLLLCNLLAGIALLAGSMAQPDSVLARYKWLAVALPLLLSLLVMLFTWVRARRREPWFVAAHWRMTARHWRLLLAAYLISGAVVSIGAFGGSDEGAVEDRLRDLPPAMQQMERRKLASQHMGSAVWARIGVVPLLLTVMALVMLESGALYQAGRGEVPDGIAARFPAPAGMSASEIPQGGVDVADD